MAQSVLRSLMFIDLKILLKLNKMYNINDFAYDTKADIYRLGVICCNLLATRMDSFDKKQKKENLKDLLIYLKKHTARLLL